jgi:Integrase zinc binding domain
MDKCYATLRDEYYWLNMRQDLEKAYIPSCTDCLRNKLMTRKPMGPLHPLPIPDDRGNSVTLDFIGPLPLDEGFDCILTMTDCLGSDIRIMPTKTNITAEDLAIIFFNNWYCENGLSKEIISDRDKLFVSKFWTALHKLTGVKIKLSSAYHPETDGLSERSNKTVNQCIRYHVRRNQKGWVRALPRI